jgi:drug/metabolite transporter (DMT)-like permease
MPLAALAELVSLAAIWGGSFLFMRLCGAEFGPAPLAALRAAGAAALLIPLLAWRGQLGALRTHWRAIAVLGVANSGLPFLFFATASLAITAGMSAIFNATTPLWGALIAWAWLRVGLDRARVAGLAVGFLGVLWLVGDRASLKPGDHGVSPAAAIALCLAATALYGYAANFTKRHLAQVPPLAQAAGSQLAAALLLAGPALWTRPAAMPPAGAWGAALALALLCTGVAYLMYFRLIARLGPATAMSVTFLIPAFALLWGGLFLHEAFGVAMAAGCAVVLVGTSLATGFWRPRWLLGAAPAGPAAASPGASLDPRR